MQLDKKYSGKYIEGVFITESDIDMEYEVVGVLKVDSKRMNSNLAELKKKLAKAGSAKGADAIINYSYGQKRTLLSLWDDTKWFASGTAVKIK